MIRGLGSLNGFGGRDTVSLIQEDGGLLVGLRVRKFDGAGPDPEILYFE